MKAKLERNKSGFCSAYMLCCGYCDIFEHENGQVRLCHETPVYHVQMSALSPELQKQFPVTPTENNRWKSFDTIAEARKHFRAMRKAIIKNSK